MTLVTYLTLYPISSEKVSFVLRKFFPVSPSAGKPPFELFSGRETFSDEKSTVYGDIFAIGGKLL